jgi:hypothetical protein
MQKNFKKLLLLVGLVSLSSVSLAQHKCSDSALVHHLNQFPQHDYRVLYDDVIENSAGTKYFETWGQKFSLPYQFATTVMLVGSEYWGGYGVDAVIMDAADCTLLKIENVYTE